MVRKMAPLAEKAVALQQKEEEKVTFVPERFENTYLRWMENIHDWCISRQLWWGTAFQLGIIKKLVKYT